MTLADVRVNIDRVDKEIKKLFKERMELAYNVAEVKAETNDDIFKPDREVSIIENLTADVDDDIKKEYIALIKRIMEISRKYQYGKTLELRDCLDIRYSSNLMEVKKAAMIKPELYICNMISKDDILTVDSFDEIADLIENNSVEAGIGILEDVSVKASDMLHSVLVERELYINRCELINDNGIKRKVAMFSKELTVLENDNRLKIMFVCHNRSGALASILSMISDYGVNLTEIHSRPNRKEQWNYEFFVELEANFLKQEIKALVFQLMNETEQFKILGSYSCEGDFK
ncbi:MAG: chorismate mutase [Lachnospiraceae bacterium]|nr:chorismate mutase [Lachnospiraceae bacterium]